MLKVKNSAESAEIVISGNIIDDDEGGMIKDFNLSGDGYEWPSAVKNQLDAVKGKPLTVYINSYGGSVAAGCAMANMIKRHDAPTTAVVDGVCCSIATQIFFAADKCKMPSNAYLMIHRPLGGCHGYADDMRKTAKILDTMQAGLESTYQAKAKDGVTREEIHDMVNGETWLTGTDAAKVFDIELTEPLNAVAFAGTREDLKDCKNIPREIHFADVGKMAEPKADAGETPDDANTKRRVEIALAIAKGAVEA